jgi:ABC-2 type transport system ATP-binding protein
LQQPLISVENLTKEYRGSQGLIRRRPFRTEALRGLSFEVRRGELFGLLGPNGAGKTTTVKILATLLLPTSGSARVLGIDVTRDPMAIRRRIGFVFGGDRGLYTRLSGLDNLRYFADLYRIPPRVAGPRIARLLKAHGLEGREHDTVERYSRGMKQRLHLARGLLNDPDVLFLDEPTIGLDPVGARDLRALVRRLADEGKTIFLTTHYMLEADAICDRIAVVNHGTIVAQGTPAELKRRVEHLGVVAFEVAGLTGGQLEALRGLPSVSSVVVSDRELAQAVTVQCANPAALVPQLHELLDGNQLWNVHVGEPTLEDAYVLLVSQ